MLQSDMFRDAKPLPISYVDGCRCSESVAFYAVSSAFSLRFHPDFSMPLKNIAYQL